MSEFRYPGSELELFLHARHWKGYWASHVRPFIGGAVLEVGAGIGANTALLRTGQEARWVCLEPDATLTGRLRENIATESSCQSCEVITGVVGSLTKRERFDTILYIDVLEHIPEDQRELNAAASHLNPGGHLIVLSPAHQWLFSAFDQAIGHCRRYTRQTLARLTPVGLSLKRQFYLDAVGMLASAANRVFLRQSSPRAGQLALWDNWMVPCSRVLDALTGYRLGKTVTCIWERLG